MSELRAAAFVALGRLALALGDGAASLLPPLLAECKGALSPPLPQDGRWSAPWDAPRAFCVEAPEP